MYPWRFDHTRRPPQLRHPIYAQCVGNLHQVANQGHRQGVWKIYQPYRFPVVVSTNSPPASTSLVPTQTPTTEVPRQNPKRFCRFCKSNQETVDFYSSHNMEENGKVCCPILRIHVCEICGGTGDNAHTKKYCPQLKSNDSPEGGQDTKASNNSSDDESARRKRRTPLSVCRNAAGGYCHSKF